MALFISDCHLGDPRCRADALRDFLVRYYIEDMLYLVGDIIDDDYRMKSWPPSHRQVLELMLRFKRITYIPGNHDKSFRRLAGIYGIFSIKLRAVHRAGDGKKYLVVHGDESDWLVGFARLVPTWLRRLLPDFGGVHDRFASSKVFKAALIQFAKLARTSGVVCGHSHVPEVSRVDGLLYVNCGDWIESCTGVVERGGKFEVMR